jgi:hypothetical protein
MNSVSFSTQATQSSFHPDNQSNIEDTLNISHKFSLEDAVFNPNPHKGVLTIDSKTSQVLKDSYSLPLFSCLKQNNICRLSSQTPLLAKC